MVQFSCGSVPEEVMASAHSQAGTVSRSYRFSGPNTLSFHSKLLQ